MGDTSRVTNLRVAIEVENPPPAEQELKSASRRLVVFVTLLGIYFGSGADISSVSLGGNNLITFRNENFLLFLGFVGVAFYGFRVIQELPMVFAPRFRDDLYLWAMRRIPIGRLTIGVPNKAAYLCSYTLSDPQSDELTLLSTDRDDESRVAAEVEVPLEILREIAHMILFANKWHSTTKTYLPSFSHEVSFMQERVDGGFLERPSARDTKKRFYVPVDGVYRIEWSVPGSPLLNQSLIATASYTLSVPQVLLAAAARPELYRLAFPLIYVVFMFLSVLMWEVGSNLLSPATNGFVP